MVYLFKLFKLYNRYYAYNRNSTTKTTLQVTQRCIKNKILHLEKRAACCLLFLTLSVVMLHGLAACTSTPSLPTRTPVTGAPVNTDSPIDGSTPEGTPTPASAFGSFYDLSFIPPTHWPKIGPDPHEGDVPPGEITIAAILGYGNLVDRAKLFMQKYPHVKITVQDYSEGNTVYDTQKYRSQISTQLMGGEGPDIVDVGLLGFPMIADKGFFVDLYEFIDKDDYIPRESYYQGILHALETDGKLYRITPFVVYEMFRVKKNFTHYLSDETLSKSTMNYRDQLQMLEELSPHISTYDELISTYRLDWLYTEVAHQYVDYKNKTAVFNNGFSDFLSEVLPWLQTDYIMTNSNGKFIIDYNVNLGFASLISYENRPYSVTWLRSYVNGDIPFLALNNLAINQNSQNPELAWTFIRFLMTVCGDPLSFMQGVPVNRNTFFKMASDPGHVGYLASLGKLSEPIDKLYIDIIEDLDAHSMSASVLTDATSMEYDLMSEIADEVLSGRLTPEEAADRIQERIMIMLNE